MFKEIAKYYDLVKSHRDYSSEAQKLRNQIFKSQPNASTLLEFACGTGTLLALLPEFKRTGVDISSEMLNIASNKSRLKDVLLITDNMTSAQLKMKFDVVLCLDGAIGYISPNQLNNTIHNFLKHLEYGGQLIIEPWYSMATWEPNKIHLVQHSDKKNNSIVVRMAHGQPDGSILFHNLVGDQNDIKHFIENYKFWLHETCKIIEILHSYNVSEADIIKPDDIFPRGLITAIL